MGEPPMTATLSSGLVAETADRQEKRRRAISGAVFSEFIDMFDIYLPTVVLSPVLFYFQPARLDPGEQAIFASLVFITTLLGRPIGALAFGVVDRLGRRMAVDHVGRGLRHHHVPDRAHSRLSPSRAGLSWNIRSPADELRYSRRQGKCRRESAGSPKANRTRCRSSPAASSSPPFPPPISPSRSSRC